MAYTKIRRLFLYSIGLSLAASSYTPSFAQSRIDSLFDKLDPQKFAASIKKKAEKLEEKLVQKSMKVLDKMQKQEEKLYSKMLSGKDSLLAKAKLSELKDKYSGLKDKLKNPVLLSKAKTYLPKLDSLSTSLKFLDQNGIGGSIKEALAKTAALQDKFHQAEEIKKFIKERKEQLKQQLEKLGMVKQLKQINKQVYYYAAQLKEYKEILNDPKKIEKKALELLGKTKLFQEFMKKNSMLASLFRMPGNSFPASQQGAGLAGLQTRAQVVNFIQQSGVNNQQSFARFQQSIQAVQSQAGQLKNKLGQLIGGNGNTLDMPDFKVNNQKTKSFFKRLEVGTNFQTQKATNFFPVTSDIGLSLGYRLNDKSIVGIGSSFKVGLGRGWNNIKFTSEGIGLRSYIDWQIKGSLWISGGYEQNYKTAFKDFNQLKDKSGWQQSGLIGISKIISMKTKLFKKTGVKLQWDFLSYRQVPRTQPIIFRIEYKF